MLAKSSRRLLLALGVLAVWTFITIYGALYQAGQGSLTELLTKHIAFAIPAAAFFLLLCIKAFKWTDVGLNRPRPRDSIKLIWPYAVYVAGLAAYALMTQNLTGTFIALVAINTAFVGFSEELAFRGVLWGAVRKAMPFWRGVFLVSAAFGAVHVLNALITGELGAAGVQALNAFLSGLALLALRIRMRSLAIVMIAHWLWDMTVFFAGAGTHPNENASTSLVGALFVAPIALYGLWLLRKPEHRQLDDNDHETAPAI